LLSSCKRYKNKLHHQTWIRIENWKLSSESLLETKKFLEQKNRKIWTHCSRIETWSLTWISISNFSTHTITRSTESESVSIARYELQNARRESLLSYNWVASKEEDMNAMLNIEEKNMNSLFFDYEMIKISINEELNAWIIDKRINDIIIFIKYITHQHDIKIKTHNDMIQMLKDVNKINIKLKTIQMTFNTIRTHLQKKIRNKNVIIYHLKTASSRQSTLILKDWFSKSIKLSDSSLFEDSRQNVNNWLSWMWNKLKMNKNHFSIKELKIAYVKSWVDETMIKHIAFQMRDAITNSFLKAEEMLLIINKMYDDLNQRHMTQQQFLRLC